MNPFWAGFLIGFLVCVAIALVLAEEFGLFSTDPPGKIED